MLPGASSVQPKFLPPIFHIGPLLLPLLILASLNCACSFGADFAITENDRAHWGFQPPRSINPTTFTSHRWTQSPIDRFILAKLQSARLTPARPASREQLIRRLYFDLIGLPPSISEIDQFNQDPAPDAIERLIDRLLASPHYGERWGRHWLDLARFAESDGFEHDAVRPNAWRYRDYVIQSFNADKPYNLFILEQLAGDELFPDNHDALVATAFNLLGPDMVDSADQIQRRHNTLNDMTDTTALVFTGLTLACARCHDHKFEPFSQRDYFRFQAFFAPAQFRNDLPIPSPAQQLAFDQANRAFQNASKNLQLQLAALEAPFRSNLYQLKLSALSEEARAALAAPPDTRTPEQLNQIQETKELLKITDQELVSSLPPEEKARHRDLKQQLQSIPKPTPLPSTLALQNKLTPAQRTHILIRGDITRPGDPVDPGFPDVLQQALPFPVPPSRASLAQWLTHPKHPLTTRVLVNRVWQHHFGRGIVPTPNDFGARGQPPTHPELLDWLATEFVAQDWSIKKLHKLILLSATYQQSTETTPHNRQLDPDNKWFSRQNRRRLEGEIIRDSLLAVSQQLNSTAGGPGVFPPIPADLFQGSTAWISNPLPHQFQRRSVYIFARRNLRFPFLEVFDAPDNNLTCPERIRSTSAPQSLTLLNSDEVTSAATNTALWLIRQSNSSDHQIDLAYRAILGRPPTPSETVLCRNFLTQSPLAELCRALFNLNSFVYVD